MFTNTYSFEKNILKIELRTGRPMSNIAKLFTNKYAKIIAIATLVLLVVLVLAIFRKPKFSNHQDSLLADETNQEIDLEHSFQIPLGDSSDQNITFRLQSAELKDSIILKGQKARAIQGKQFLIINLKLENDQEQRIKLDTRDYVRLTVNNSEDRLAPQIHNDPVEVQPISDQFTRVGFSISKSDSDFKLFVGPIAKDKTELPLNFNQ